MSSAIELESLRRVELLRAELDRSLKLAAADTGAVAAPEKRPPPLVLFQSTEAVHVQISGSVRVPSSVSGIVGRPRSVTAPIASSRFTVSPTPNAVPAATTADGPPLRVLTIGDKAFAATVGVAVPASGGRALDCSDLPPPVSASSPASSVDSGVAVSPPPSAGSSLLTFPPTASPPAYPSWATVPRTRRWVFSFGGGGSCGNGNNGSLIDALALSGRRFINGRGATPTATPVTDPPPLTLQKPPTGKKYGPTNTTTEDNEKEQSTEAISSPSSQNNNNNQPEKDGYCSNSNIAMVSSSTATGGGGSPGELNQLKENNNNQNKFTGMVINKRPKPAASGAVAVAPQPQQPMQRQLSEGCASLWDDGFCGLPPRAATMPPLKSILKKPRTENGCGNAGGGGGGHVVDHPRNHLRRQPIRMVLNRSISESLLDNHGEEDRFNTLQSSAAAAFNATILSKLTSLTNNSSANSGAVRGGTKLDPFDEQQEEQQLKMEQQKAEQEASNTTSSSSACTPSSCSSETIDSDGQPAPIVKKRVSFSEHVQARIYRSNSSILGQRRKNEKKSRNRTNKRCNSEHSEDENLVEQQHFQAKASTSGPATFQQNPSPNSLICRSRDSASIATSATGPPPLLAQ